MRVSELLHLKARSTLPVIGLIYAFCSPDIASAVDEVVYLRASVDKPGPQRLVGKIADFNGRELRLINKADQERKIPAARVLRVEYTRSELQRQGEKSFAAGDFEKAAKQLDAALSGNGEKRPWVRREIAAQLVHCYAELEQWSRAGELFLLIVHDDPDVRQFDAIPLGWMASQPTAQLEQQAKKWLQDAANPVANLIGASHLLSTAERGAATIVLQRLQRDKDNRIAMFAAAQLWRTRAAVATPDEITRWQETMSVMPSSLLAGPLLVYGETLARQQPGDAATALLRVALLYPTQRRLATRAAERAAAALEKVDAASATLIRQKLKPTPNIAALGELEEANEDERFIAGLRDWRLYHLAESYCRQQLEPTKVSESKRAELTVELMRTLSEHAGQLTPGDRAQLWKAVQQVSADFETQLPASERLMLVGVQEAIALTQQAHLLQEEAEIVGSTPKLLEPAQDLLRTAINSLRQLESDISDLLRQRQKNPATAKDGLSVAELTTLRTRAQYALGHALLVQSETYSAGSDDRINSLSQAIESLRQVAELAVDEPVTWQSRFEEAIANRLIGRSRAALKLLARLQQSSPPAKLLSLCLAEEIRCHLAEENLPAALKLIQSVDPSTLPPSGEFDLAQLEAYMAAWRAAQLQRDEKRAAGWEEVAARVVRQMEERDGTYWARRGESLLATIIARAPAGDFEALARSAASFQRAGKLPEALEAYDRAIAGAKSARSSERLFEISVAAGLIEHKQKRFSEASRRLRAAALAAPNHAKAPDAHLVAVQDTAAWAQQQDPPALADYIAILREHLEHWPGANTVGQIAWWLGQLLQQQGKWQEAVAALIKVPANHPQAAAATEALSVCYDHLLDSEQAAGKPIEKAARDLAAAFEKQFSGAKPGDKWSPAMRHSAMASARMWLRAGDKGAVEAERVLRAALDGSLDAPNEWRSGAMALLATSYVQQRRMADAGKMLTQVAAGSPDDLLRLLDSLSSSPQNTSPDQQRRLAGLQLQILQLLENSTSRLDVATRLKLKKIEAQGLARIGKTAEARKAFEAIVDELPDDGAVQEDFASLLSQTDDAEQLRAALVRWRALERKSRPGSPRWFRASLGAAKTQLALGSKSQARATIKLTQATRPDLGGEAMKQEFLALLKQCE